MQPFDQEIQAVCGSYAGCIVCGLRAAKSKFEFPIEFDFPIQLTEMQEVKQSEKVPKKHSENLSKVGNEN